MLCFCRWNYEAEFTQIYFLLLLSHFSIFFSVSSSSTVLTSRRAVRTRRKMPANPGRRTTHAAPTGKGKFAASSTTKKAKSASRASSQRRGRECGLSMSHACRPSTTSSLITSQATKSRQGASAIRCTKSSEVSAAPSTPTSRPPLTNSGRLLSRWSRSKTTQNGGRATEGRGCPRREKCTRAKTRDRRISALARTAAPRRKVPKSALVPAQSGPITTAIANKSKRHHCLHASTD